MKKYNIFAGNYGSGKTEISLNLAIREAKNKKRVVLVDMDIVNPYFRSSEHEQMLANLGIRVIKPQYANTNADVPSLPAEIYAPFDMEDVDIAIFDSGGDPVGAAAMGQLSEKFANVARQTDFFYVLNPKRPFQETAEDILEMLREVELRSGMNVTALVNNTNLAKHTYPELLLEGLPVIEAVAQSLQIPIGLTCLREGLAMPEGAKRGEVLYIRPMTRPDWLY